jgi:hypothetical protein
VNAAREPEAGLLNGPPSGGPSTEGLFVVNADWAGGL